MLATQPANVTGKRPSSHFPSATERHSINFESRRKTPFFGVRPNAAYPRSTRVAASQSGVRFGSKCASGGVTLSASKVPAFVSTKARVPSAAGVIADPSAK